MSETKNSAMKQNSWQIPVLLLVLLYHVLRATVVWAPEQPDPDPTPTREASATPTAQYTAASRPVAWVVLPTNTPSTGFVAEGLALFSDAGDKPTRASATETSTPRPTPSPAPTSTMQVASRTPPPTSRPPPTPNPVATSVTHVVQSGETLSAIAKQYGVAVQDILVANSLTNPDVLSVDQVLIIPAPRRPSPTATATP